MRGVLRVRSAWVAALLAFTLAEASDARAAELVLEGPRSCSQAAELASRVERALGRPLAEVRPALCSVNVVRDGGSYAARFTVSPGGAAAPHQRAFSGKTCAKLMQTLELAMVLALGADERPLTGATSERVASNRVKRARRAPPAVTTAAAARTATR